MDCLVLVCDRSYCDTPIYRSVLGGEIVAEGIQMAVIIVATFAGIAVVIVGVFLGLTLIKKHWPDVWD